MKISTSSESSQSVRLITAVFGTGNFLVEIPLFPCVYYGILNYHLRLSTISTHSSRYQVAKKPFFKGAILLFLHGYVWFHSFFFVSFSY